MMQEKYYFENHLAQNSILISEKLSESTNNRKSIKVVNGFSKLPVYTARKQVLSAGTISLIQFRAGPAQD